ncbi:type IV secretion system protein [Helicobacter typhlonius]|uniref:type IV secretion system protein n=1 Tax=Helicobacter typhlonius TaxID=76936 RepID=UPI002FDF9338
MDIYDFIITLFQKVAEGFATGMLNALTEVMKVKILFNLIGMIVIITFAVKKLQEGDFFTWKNLTQIILMMLYVGFFNWAVENPKIYMEYFGNLISYPAETLTTHISHSTLQQVQSSPQIQSAVGYLIQKTFDASIQIVIVSAPEFSWGSFKGQFLALFAAIVYFVCTMIFIIVVLLVILVAELQILIWKALALLMIALMFLPQTRKMVGSYIIYIVGLTLYKPLVLVMCFFNFSVADYILTNMPSRNELLKGKDMITAWVKDIAVETTIIGYIGVGIIGCFICVYLVKQVPSFINQVIGAGGSVGAGIAQAGAKALGMTTGGAAGMAAGAVGGMAKSGYQGGGGGIGGLASAASALVTGGLSNASFKGAGGKQLGQKINDAINKTKGGSKANDLVSKGVSAGSNTAKELTDKIMGKNNK